VLTSGPELIAGSIPSCLNINGKNKPKVVATIIAENMPVPNALTIGKYSLNSIANPDD
jgi:hypothetical protein